MGMKMLGSEAYSVGWVSAVRVEYTAARQFLDEEYECPPQARTDNNVYTVGRIGDHNVVLATLPNEEYGLVSAATVVRDMVHSFPNIRIGLMVGIAGGAPSRKRDIRLGDVVVSSPDSSCGTRHGGVFQYDFGKTIQDRKFTPTGFLNQPPTLLRAAVADVRSRMEEEALPIKETIESILERKPRLKKSYGRPADETDVLYVSSFLHQSDDQCCEQGSQIESQIVKRRERAEDEDDPAFHYGTIASANQLMKNAEVRDQLADEESVLCFEMEAAGLMNHFPCLVIRGICDYSDTHKNKAWQGYAAMTAAAYAKVLLSRIASEKVKLETSALESLSSIQEEITNIQTGLQKQQELKALRVEQKTLQSIQEWFCKDDAQHHHDDIRSRQPLDQATAEWLFDGPEAVSRTFCQWRDGNDAARVLWATGDPAVGKTTVASQVIQHLRHHAATATTNSAGRIGIAWTYVNMAKTAEPQNSKLPAWILRSLIRILISQTSGIPASATDLVAKSKTAGRSPSNAELLSCLTSICEVAYDTVYFIIDGLDEASHDACYELIGHLKELPSNARCMLTSRYNQTLQNALPSPSRIHIRANRRDAELYFAQEVLRKPNFAAALRTLERSKPGAARRAQDAIVEKTDESFLTAKLCLEELLKSRTPHQIETALTNLPKSHELYQTIFRRLKAKWELPGDRQWAKKILTMVCFSDIPFSPRDLLYIVGLDLDAPRVDHSDILDAPLITDYCDGLITIHVKSEKVALVHVQAKKFFEENQEEYFPDAHYEIAERYIAHVMAQSSVGYIHHHDLFNMSIFAVKNLGSEVRKHLAQTLPGRFSTLRRLTSQSITAMNVTTSADELKSPAMDEQNQRLITKLAAMICDPGCAAIICQVFIEMSPWHSLREDSSNIFNSPSPYWERLGWTRLHIVAAMGLAEVARHFVTNVAPLDTVDLFGKSAVAVAMDRQHPDVAEILVHAGAEVDIFSATGQTVLITAVGRGHLDFARKILTSSEATAPWSKIFTKPRKDSKDLRLLLAALDNDIATVKKICERSKVADDPMAATALLLSADCGHRDIMKLLLAAAVPVGSHDAEGRTALHRAARRNDKAMAEMLLSHSADVDVTSVFGLTAWSEVVASSEHEDMVKLLVAHATDINVADQDGVSTLYIAAAGGHLGLVSKLLAVGADASIRTRFGWTPLHWAANGGHFDVVSELLTYGADVSAISDTGKTPLEQVLDSGSHHDHMRANLLQDTQISTTAAYVHKDVHPHHVEYICTSCQMETPDGKLAFTCSKCPPAPYILCSACLVGNEWCSDRGHAMQSVWASPDKTLETISVDLPFWESVKDTSVAALLRKHGALTTNEVIRRFEGSMGLALSMTDWRFMLYYGEIRSIDDELDRRLYPYLSAYESSRGSEVDDDDNDNGNDEDGNDADGNGADDDFVAVKDDGTGEADSDVASWSNLFLRRSRWSRHNSLFPKYLHGSQRSGRREQ